MVRVWDIGVRVLHGVFVFGVAAAWLTRHSRGDWHEWIGYAVAAAVILRVIWGAIGTPHARFAAFVRGPRTTARYAMRVLHGDAPRHLGHNPLGAAMIVALLLLLVTICVTGWLFTTDRFWGEAWVIGLHSYATDALLLLLPLHIAGVLHASWKHRENLVLAMIHGRKRGEDAPPSGTSPG